MIGRLKELGFTLAGRQVLTLELNEDFRKGYDDLSGKDLDIEIRVHREKRSVSANAYFHVLVNKIAHVIGASDTEVKRRLVVDYGAAMESDGQKVGFKLPAEVVPEMIYPYVRMFDERYENGKLFRCYIPYKHTHDMNTEEMARLIDGAIFEAKCLGIETDTPAEIAKLKSLWAEGD